MGENMKLITSIMKESLKKGFSIANNAENANLSAAEMRQKLEAVKKEETDKAKLVLIQRELRKKVTACRLGQLRREAGLSQKAVAEKLNIPVTTLSGYERGVSEPPLETMVQLADLYNASADYILCRTDEKTIKVPDAETEERQNALERIQAMADELERLKETLK